MAQFQQQMEQIVAALESRPRLLLHSCCGPCSSAVIERLAPHFDLTVYYYNPNIYPPQEYRRRADEQARLLETLGVPMIEAEYDTDRFDAIGLADEPEGGARCRACYALRLEQSARYAKEQGYEATACFVVQMKGMKHLEPNDVTHPEFGAALRRCAQAGIEIMALECDVIPGKGEITGAIPVIL